MITSKMGVFIGSSSVIESLEFLKYPESGYSHEIDFWYKPDSQNFLIFSQIALDFLFRDSEVNFLE